MRRAAIYARYSTDLQSERSVEDQLALCEGFAAAHGIEIAGRYADRARSGATVRGRDGLSRLLQDARDRRFDTIIVEALDRLSRDQEDLAGIHKRLTFAGIEIVAVHDGRADAIQIGIRGLVSTLFLTDLKHKIRRGMSGRVRAGRTPGGQTYGYRPTPGDPGRPQVYAPEAEVVRRIFAEYLAGQTPRDIATGLNRDGIPAPRGRRWSASTINGNGKRGHGLIRNPIYAGRIVWGRVQMVRDPETGRRVSRPAPQEQWQSAEAPELALIERETWQAAQDRREGRPGAGERAMPHRKRKRLLSGLLRCGVCGGGLVMHDRWGDVVRVRCSAAHETGSCSNRRRYRLDKIEACVITGIAERLRDVSGLRSYLDSLYADQRADGAARARLARDIAGARGKIDRMARMLVDGRVPEDFFDKEMPEARAQLAALEARLASAPEPQVVTLHPAAIRLYTKDLASLASLMRETTPEDEPELFASFRALIRKVRVIDQPGGAVECEVEGSLGPLVRAPSGGSVVAEVRLPPTPPICWGRFSADFRHSHRAPKLRNGNGRGINRPPARPSRSTSDAAPRTSSPKR